MPTINEPPLVPPKDHDVEALWAAAHLLVDLIKANGHEGEHFEQHIHNPSGFRIDIRQREGAFKIEIVAEEWLRRGLR